MEFSQLRIFQAVAEEGSITRAAERLHRVPSNLSTRLKQLEEQLGVELFVRERQRLQLSPAGKVLLDGLWLIPYSLCLYLAKSKAMR